jgi:hypothetical protein
MSVIQHAAQDRLALPRVGRWSLSAVLMRADVLQALLGSSGVPTVGNVLPQALKVRTHG